jgi:putative transposase
VITHRPEHLKTFDYLGLYRYFLMFCTHQRHQAFVAAERVDLVLMHILRTSTEQGMAMIAYCFMPDHVHLPIEGTEPASDCRAFIARAKQFSGFYYAKTFRERLWQRYG